MTHEDDETKLARTLDPTEFPSSSPGSIAYDWRLQLGKTEKDLIVRAVNESLHTDDVLAQLSKIAVITEFGQSDTIIQVTLLDEAGNRLAVVRIEQQGWGKAYLLRDS